MLNVIDEDFIKPESIDTVLPFYRELIAATTEEPCVLLIICTGMKRIRGIIFSLKSGLTGQHSIHAAPASISLGLFP